MKEKYYYKKKLNSCIKDLGEVPTDEEKEKIIESLKETIQKLSKEEIKEDWYQILNFVLNGVNYSFTEEDKSDIYSLFRTRVKEVHNE